VDTGTWAKTKPVSDIAEIAGAISILFTNWIFWTLTLLPLALTFVISATPQPELYKKGNILYKKPGALAEKIHKASINARIIVDDSGIHPELINLE
jgi:hypothetical protein